MKARYSSSSRGPNRGKVLISLIENITRQLCDLICLICCHHLNYTRYFAVKLPPGSSSTAQNLKALFSSISKNKKIFQPGRHQFLERISVNSNQGGESQRAEQGVVKYFVRLPGAEALCASGWGMIWHADRDDLAWDTGGLSACQVAKRVRGLAKVHAQPVHA